MGRGEGSKHIKRPMPRREKEKRTLVIADVHGHYDRLKALLVKAGVVDAKTEKRINHDVRVIQLGDLGHFGNDGARTGDRMCYEKALEWFDGVCWGNHDRSVVSPIHAFTGCEGPDDRTWEVMMKLNESEKLKVAHTAHGYLLTHAGLHAGFSSPAAPSDIRIKPEELDEVERLAEELNDPERFLDVWNAIPTLRGGPSNVGGPLWRHDTELLEPKVPQVFGHTKRDKIREFESEFEENSVCLDVGSEDNGRLAAIWLPDREIIEVRV